MQGNNITNYFMFNLLPQKSSGIFSKKLHVFTPKLEDEYDIVLYISGNKSSETVAGSCSLNPPFLKSQEAIALKQYSSSSK